MTASVKCDIAQDTMLIGIGVSPGVSIGEAYLMRRAKMAAIERSIEGRDVAGEVQAFRDALEQSRGQLHEVKRKVQSQVSSDHLYILDAHLMILDDPMLIEETITTIQKEQVNAEGALQRSLQKFRRVFDEIEDEYLRERGSDIEAVGDRILRNLMGESQFSLTGIMRQAVVVAHDLSPADTVQIDKRKILGFVTDLGGRTSHTAILARSLGIPAVVGLENATSLVPGSTPMIIDGSSGTVILNPSTETFREYLKKKQAFEYFEQELLSYRDLPAVTEDGYRLTLKGNVELPEEVAATMNHGGEGIGLFRTEFLFLGQESPPSEEEQFLLYRDLVKKMAPHSVTIRTLDIGGDKYAPDINLVDEANPALGLRGVRFSLTERRMLETQLRAILRASAFGPVRIMFPMISGVAEVRACRAMIRQIMETLEQKGIPFDPATEVGIMIETPSAVLIADFLAQEVDFFSVGTNDLIQYCLAVDRGNEHVAYLYEPLHPAILRALASICKAGREAEIEVAMCGEMSSDPLYLLILIGLGFTELSMNAPCISRVKRVLRRLRQADAGPFLEKAMQMRTAAEVASLADREMTALLPDIFEEALI